MKQVLIIEDDRDIANLISIHLKDMDFEVSIEHDGQKGLLSALNNKYNIIILDIMLPGMDGLEVCRRIRIEKIQTPILMLTSKAEEIDKVLGLEIGADDYLTKPFSVRELIARIKALLRRTEMISNPHTEESNGKNKISFDNLFIDIDKRIVEAYQQRVELSPKEFDLLVLLASHPGKTYTRDQLLNRVWGYEFSGYEHTVNSHINRLRSKIEKDMNHPEFVLTTWGVGYRFNES